MDAFLEGKIVSVSNITSDYANKQDKIVSGQHIKTINGVNIVGPGDVSLYDGLNVVGVDSTLDSSSINPVQNKVVANKIYELEKHIQTQDSSLETYIKNQDSSIIDVITWENISKE